MKLTLHVHDKLKLYSKTFLSMHHMEIVNLLYQPIMGQEATNLYFTLWTLFQMEKRELILSHGQVLTFFNWDLNKLVKFRHKLESIGLLTTHYHNREGYYVYELKQPMTAKQYFQDSNLNIHLMYSVGDHMYHYLEHKFMISDLNPELVNVSKNFEDSFKPIDAPTILNENQYITTTVNSFKVPITYDFDFELFSILVGRSFINTEKMSLDVKQAIIKEAALYQFDAQMMSKIVLECEENGDVDVKKLHEISKRYYKRLKVSGTSIEKQKTMTEEEFDATTNQNEMTLKKEALKNYKTKTPQEWLRILQNDTEVPSAMLEVVNVLYEEYKLPSEVINVLIEFVRFRNDGRLPMEYTKAIASTWAYKNIKTAEEAM